MLFFFILAMHLISQGKNAMAAPIYAASIMLKLVPVLFLPLLLPLLGIKKSLFFYVLTGLACLLFMLPFYSPQFIGNYSETIALWFSNFEFNAGFYNLVKTIALEHYDAKPWEVVKDYGKLIPFLIILLSILLTIFRDKRDLRTVFLSMLILLTSYYLLSTTVHPWYIIFLLGISLFTQYRFTVHWSGLVILSYYAYSQPDFKENLWLLTIEYLLVLIYLAYEIVRNHNISGFIRKKA